MQKIRRPSVKRSLRKYWDLYLILIPVVAYFVLFKFLPMYGLQIAFRDYKPRRGFWGSDWVGLKHFIRFFSTYTCWQIISNTLVLSLLTLFFTFPLPILLALILNEMRDGPCKKTVQTITYAPHFLSTVVVVGMITAFCSPSTGIVNTLIKAFGGDPIYFMAKAEWFRPLYVISEVWTNTGWDSIIFLSALSSVDVQMYEAAKIDGASRMKMLRWITLPSIMPTIAIMLILHCGRVMSIGFEKVFLLQTDLNIGVSEVISTFVYQQGIRSAQTSYATAVGLMNSVVNFILVITVNTISKRVSEVSLW
jgi:putative aldouronate transport system permease protein